MSAQIIELGPNDNMTPEQALSVTLRESLEDVVIVGYNEEGELFIRSSSMENKDALWILAQAQSLLLRREYA